MLIIRLSCLGIFLSLLGWPVVAHSWDNVRPYSQQEDDDPGKDDKDQDNDAEESVTADAGADSGEKKKAGSKAAEDGGVLPEPQTRPEMEKRPLLPTVPTPRMAAPKAGTPSSDPQTGVGVGIRKTPLPIAPASPKPTQKPADATKTMALPGHVMEGRLSLDTSYSQASLIWELRVLWLVVGSLLLAFVLLLFHFLLPFQGLRALGKFSHSLLVFGTIVLVGVLGYQYIFLKIPPGSTNQSGLLWFGAAGLIVHLWQRRAYPQVYINAGVLLLVVSAALAWSLVGHLHLPGLPVASHQLSFSWLLGHFSMYTAFGILAASGSWMISSMFLGMLARRERGTGYGLQPEEWEEYRLHPSFLVFLAYPWLTISWVTLLLSSQFVSASPIRIWQDSPRLFSVLFVWLLLTAHLFALRSPKNQEEYDAEDLTFAVSQKTPKFPNFLLFLATVGGCVLFVGIHIFLSYLRNL